MRNEEGKDFEQSPITYSEKEGQVQWPQESVKDTTASRGQQSHDNSLILGGPVCAEHNPQKSQDKLTCCYKQLFLFEDDPSAVETLILRPSLFFDFYNYSITALST